MSLFPVHLSGSLYLADPRGAPAAAPPRGRAFFIAARLISYAAPVAVFILAARMLAPAEIGLFALMQACALLLLAVAAPGWREFVAGWRGPPSAINQALTLAMVNGYCAGAAGIVAAAVLAVGSREPAPAYIALLLSAGVFIAPATQTLSAVLERRAKTTSLAMIDVAAELAALGVAAGGLMAGLGVVALAAGSLTLALVRFIGVAAATRWRLALPFPTQRNRHFFRAARKVKTRYFLEYLSANSAIFFVAVFLGLGAAGYFKVAQIFVSVFATPVFAPLRRIAWTALRTASAEAGPNGDDTAALAKQTGVLKPLAIILASPVLICLALVADELVPLLLGDQWRPAAIIASILSVSALVSLPILMIDPLMSLAGRPDRITLAAAAAALFAIFFLLLFSRFGPVAAALAQLGATVFSVLSALWLQHRTVKTPWASTLRQGAPVYAALAALVAAMLGARLALDGVDISSAARLSLQAAAGAIAYAALLLFINPSYLRRSLWLD